MNFKTKAMFTFLISILSYSILIYFNIDSCLVKSLFGFPCPSCGTTRALIELSNFEVVNSIIINPLGVIAFFFFISFLILIIIDFVFKKKYLELVILKIEIKIKNKFIFIFICFLITINWIWNFYKGY